MIYAVLAIVAIFSTPETKGANLENSRCCSTRPKC